MRNLFGAGNTRVLLGLTAVVGGLSVIGCANEAQPKELTAPQSATPVLVTERKLTPAEIDALIMSHDTAFARQVRNAQQANLSARLVDDGSGSTGPTNTTVPTSPVTEAGAIAGSTVTTLDTRLLMASWASETKVTSGYARRVFLQTQGDYSQTVAGQTTYNLRRFSGVCGEKTTDLFKQDCKLGDIYLDVSCSPSTTGHIFAQSQHGATFGVFTSNTITRAPTVSLSDCSASAAGDDGGAGGGDDTCNDYQLVDDPTGYTGGDCSSPTGTGDPSDPTSPPNTTGDWQKLCDELLLSPGCYDVYVDGAYDSTICC